MAAMTMPWKVQTANMLDNLGPGDLITSEIVVDDNQGVVTKITKLGTAKPDVPRPPGRRQPGVKYLVPGDAVPNQAFVDQDGRTRDFNDDSRRSRDGHHVHLHEVPDPDVLSGHGSPVRRSAGAHQGQAARGESGAAVGELRSEERHAAGAEAHARKLGADPKVWTFVTGDRDEIDRFASSLLLTLVRGEAANPDEIGHTLRTTVVDSSGKIAKSYSGADWTPAELVAELERLL